MLQIYSQIHRHMEQIKTKIQQSTLLRYIITGGGSFAFELTVLFLLKLAGLSNTWAVALSFWKEGYDIVYTRRDDSKVKTTWFKKTTSKMFYKVLNSLSELDIEEGAADFRLLDRKVVNVINDVPESNLFLRGFINWAGFKVFAVDYVPAERFSGVSKYSFKKMFALASLGITQFSVKPLRIANGLGAFSALAGIAYGIYVIIQRLAFDNTVSGWASVTICVLVLGGVQLIILGIIGEYLGRTFMQTKSRPEYIVREQTVR